MISSRHGIEISDKCDKRVKTKVLNFLWLILKLVEVTKPPILHKIKASMYINFDKENSEKDPKFKVGDSVRISNNFFLKKRLHSKFT